MKLSYPNTNFTIAQYIIMPYYILDERWKPYQGKIDLNVINESLEWLYVNDKLDIKNIYYPYSLKNKSVEIQYWVATESKDSKFGE